MMPEAQHIFISVGTTSTEEQEAFVLAVEARLRAEGLIPHTVGRDTFSSDAPLLTVTNLIKRCSGAVVIALERSYFPAGLDKPGGPKQAPLTEVRLATPWNQIEAAMAYVSGLPLLVIVEVGVRGEGLLERGYDWWVQQVALVPSSLSTTEFNGVLASWKQKIATASVTHSEKQPDSFDPGQMSIGALARSLKPGQLWSIITAIIALGRWCVHPGNSLYPQKMTRVDRISSAVNCSMSQSSVGA